MNKKQIKIGLGIAAIANIVGVLVFSNGFTNAALNYADPVVMSNFGLVMIMVWGLAYFSTIFIDGNIKPLLVVFATEKLVYVIVWGNWLVTHSLIDVYAENVLAGIFFTIYGFNDLLFMLLFCYMVYSLSAFSQKSVTV